MSSPEERCISEILRCETDLRAGVEPVEGLVLGLHDWCAELRVLRGSEAE